MSPPVQQIEIYYPRKNCNSFTDVAMGFLLDMRLDEAYRGVDKVTFRIPLIRIG